MNRFQHLTLVSGFLLISLMTRARSQEVGGFVTHWRLDEASGLIGKDAAGLSPEQPSGYNYGLIQEDSSPDWLPQGGVSRGAYHFDGTASMLMEGYAGSTKSISLAMWIRPSSWQDATLGHKMEEGESGKGWSLLLTADGAVEFRIGSSDNFTAARATHAYRPGEWTQITAVFEGPGKKEKLRARATLAIDGVVSAVVCELPQTPGAGSSRLILGAPFLPASGLPPQPLSHHYIGDLDRFLIWSRGLKRKDMAALADFNDPTNLSVEQSQTGNLLDWNLSAEDPDLEDDFDFTLLPDPAGADRGGASIQGGVLSFVSLPEPGKSFVLTIRANDGTGRGIERTFTFTTPVKPVEGGGGDGDGDGWGEGCGEGDVDGSDEGGTVTLPGGGSQNFVSFPVLTQEWTPLAVPPGTSLGRLSADVYRLDARPSAVRDFTLVPGEGDADNALFSLSPETVPGNPQTSALLAVAPLELHDGRIFHIRVRAAGRIGGAEVTREGAISFSAVRLHLNEFLADNEFGLEDEDGETSDWIEVFNAGGHPLRLRDWCVTNDPGRPALWTAPALILPGGGYHCFFASKKGGLSQLTGTRLRPNHTTFTLKKEEGEYLGLYAPDGETMASEYTFLPAQKADDSYGCYLDNPATRGPMDSMTPGRRNGPAPLPVAAPVVAVPGHGFYGGELTVTLSCATAGASIYYTLDGSLPTPSASQLYSGPLTLADSTSLRAMAFAAEKNPSKLLTASYILAETVSRQTAMGPGDSAAVAGAIRALPALSMTMLPGDLLALGKPPNADLPRTAELEWLASPAAPAGSVEFQQTADIRIAGQSRVGVSPKSAFRLSFDDWLKVPLFGEGPARQFKELALRTPFQNSWLSPEPGERPRGQEIRDEFVRRLHGRMGHLAPIGNFVHLFINGQYYGLFNPTEVPGDLWQFSYGGCSDDDFDTLKEGGVQDDESQRAGLDWGAADAFAREKPVTAEDYLNILGEAIDLDSLIDMILLRAYAGDEGFEFWSGPEMKGQHNWFAGREWVNKKPFRFFTWDAESTLGDADLNTFAGPKRSTLFEKLITQVDFRARVTARVQRHFYEDGALAGNAPRELYAALAEEIEPAIPAEAARWGSKNPEGGSYGLSDWKKERDRLLGVWFPARREALLAQLTALGLNVRLARPTLIPAAGWYPAGTVTTAEPEAGTLIYYTQEAGKGPALLDPRSAGGAVSLQARPWTGSLTLTENSLLTLRAFRDGVWSPPLQAAYRIGPQRPDRRNFVVSEIMYHGAESTKANFLEFHNPSAEPVDVTGLVLSDGVRFNTGNAPRVLEPGAYGLVVEDGLSFSRVYGTNLPVWGQWSGALDPEGEAVTVTLPRSEFAGGLAFDYSSGRDWPRDAAVKAFSLVPVDPSVWIGEDEPSSWRASSVVLGSPGAADQPGMVHPRVVINEVLSVGPDTSVELRNTGDSPADISGWILAPPDWSGRPESRLVIPAATLVPPGGYVVLRAASGLIRDFSRLELSSASPSGALTGYVDSLALYPLPDGVSLGPYTASDGSHDSAPLAAPTLGAVNLWPRVPQVVINEIMYHPADDDPSFPAILEVEWIEILNRADVPVNLAGLRLPQWGFAFPAQSLPPHGLALVINSADRELFRQHWRVPPTVPVFTAPGLFLSNSEPFVILGRSEPDGTDFGYTEWVRAADREPWPESADGEGRSLERYETGVFANDPIAWRASYQYGGSPGRLRAASFESWRKANFSASELLRPVMSGTGGDPDRDELNNLGEYAFGGDPHKLTEQTRVTLKATVPAGGVEISFPRRGPGLSSAAYEVEVSNGLGGWRTVTSHCSVIRRLPLPDGLEEATFLYTGPETALPRCFLRIVTRLTPP